MLSLLSTSTAEAASLTGGSCNTVEKLCAGLSAGLGVAVLLFFIVLILWLRLRRSKLGKGLALHEQPIRKPQNELYASQEYAKELPESVIAELSPSNGL